MIVRFATCVFLLLAAPAMAADGCMRFDGDTLLARAGGKRIRLLGVDTPEMSCRCESECAMARRAKAFTGAKLKEAKRVDLVRFPPDKYGRTLARVYLDGRDLSDMLIEAGLGRAYSGAIMINGQPAWGIQPHALGYQAT